MRSAGGESLGQLQPELGSADVLDFLYVDRARISALYAQLFPQGILTSVKTTAYQSSSNDSNIGTDVRVFKAETKSVDSGSEGIEHQFDASWSIPLDVLSSLKDRALIHESPHDTGLGGIVLQDCLLRVIDFNAMDNLWSPALKLAFADNQPQQEIIPEVIPTLTEALKGMPRAVHAHYLTNDAFLWSALEPANLTIPTSDLTLKYGGTISGSWKLLYILDAWPDPGQPPDTSGWSGGQMIDGILAAMHALRTMAGRPSNWLGITPLMIFRDATGWFPSPPPSVSPSSDQTR